MSRSLLAGLLAAALTYTLALLLGTALFLTVTRAGVFGAVPILFYRGLAGLALTFALLWAAMAAVTRRRRLGLPLAMRDAFGASVTAAALLLAAFVVGPVTVDRSVSVFMLGRFAAAPEGLDAPAVEDAFRRTYLEEWRQIPRRLDEQVASGNLVRDGDRYRLTPQGARFMRIARGTARLFDTDRRFVGLSDRP
ncbi:hypothetical protein [Methylobacterium sp. JK268]